MKTKDVLKWIVKQSIQGELLGTCNVPEQGEAEWQQNENWWWRFCGGLPPAPVESGEYLYYYTSQIPDFIETEQGAFHPDAEVELSCGSYIYFYKLED